MNYRTTIMMATCALLAVTSCKKKTNDSPVRDYLVGKWAVTGSANDDNKNGVMDAGEVKTDSTFSAHFFVFAEDGKLSYQTYNGKVAGSWTWTLISNNTYLKTEDVSSTPKTYYQHIDNITSSALTLRDTTGRYPEWLIYTKQ